jgi:hypothetical protein
MKQTLKIGDQVAVTVIGTVTELFSSGDNLDIVSVTSDGVYHNFWPATEKSINFCVLNEVQA